MKKWLRKWWWDFEFFGRQNCMTAYWCGFLMADGCLQDNGGGKKQGEVLTLKIHDKDRNHLEKYCDALHLDHEVIKRASDKPANYVKIRGQKEILSQTLIRWGIVRRKSHIFIAPKIPKNLLLSYIVGWIDGDGYIQKSSPGHYGTFIEVSGNTAAMIWFRKSLRLLGINNIYIRTLPNKPNVSVVKIGGAENTLKLAERVFMTEVPYLERKWGKLRS